MAETPSPPPLLVRLLARWWYVWGLNLCYRGNRTAERAYYESGVRSFTRALDLWPTMAHVYYRRGLICGRELGNYAAAFADLYRATELCPEWAEPYLQRGLFYRFQGNPTEAIANLQRFLELSDYSDWREEAEHQIAQIRAELGA